MNCPLIHLASLVSLARTPVVSAGQVSAKIIILCVGRAGLFKRGHGIIKATQVEVSDAKIGVGLGRREKSNSMLQDFNRLPVITHEYVDATQHAIAMGIIGGEGYSLAEFACRFRVFGLARVKTAQPAVSRPIPRTDLNGKPIGIFRFG